MAKREKDFVPFFKISNDIEETFKHLRHELLMTISFMDTCLTLDGVTPEAKIPTPMREQMEERLKGLRKVCSAEEE